MNEHRQFDALKVTEKFWRERIATASIITHPTAKGDVAEVAWRELLSKYLPDRYKVSCGFVVSADNQRSHQIDAIVYDNTFTPMFFGEHGLSCVPAEAVYAVLEIKQVVNAKHIQYASKQARSVRDLRRTSAKYTGDGQSRDAKPLFPIIAGLMAHKIGSRGWKHQVQALNSLQEEDCLGALDIVFTAENGSVDYFKTAFPERNPTVNSNEGGLMLGVLRLVEALQIQGTVPAIDWNDWLSNFKS